MKGGDKGKPRALQGHHSLNMSLSTETHLLKQVFFSNEGEYRTRHDSINVVTASQIALTTHKMNKEIKK